MKSTASLAFGIASNPRSFPNLNLRGREGGSEGFPTLLTALLEALGKKRVISLDTIYLFL